jgi:hypothetical protein
LFSESASPLSSAYATPRAPRLTYHSNKPEVPQCARLVAADIAFCVAAYANSMTEDRIERALEDDYLSRDPSISKRTAYIRRTMELPALVSTTAQGFPANIELLQCSANLPVEVAASRPSWEIASLSGFPCSVSGIWLSGTTKIGAVL